MPPDLVLSGLVGAVFAASEQPTRDDDLCGLRGYDFDRDRVARSTLKIRLQGDHFRTVRVGGNPNDRIVDGMGQIICCGASVGSDLPVRGIGDRGVACTFGGHDKVSLEAATSGTDGNRNGYLIYTHLQKRGRATLMDRNRRPSSGAWGNKSLPHFQEDEIGPLDRGVRAVIGGRGRQRDGVSTTH